MGRARQAGQGSVEAVGLALAVALLLAALAVWAGRAGPLPASPPVGLDPLTGLLGGDGDRAVGVLGAPSLDLSTLRGGPPSPIGRVLRGVAHVVRIGAPAFAGGAADRLRERLRALVRHPVATIRETLRAAARDATDPVGALRSRVGDLAAYVAALRAMSGDDAVRRIARDLGGAATDAAISRFVRIARGRIGRALARAAGPRPPVRPVPPAPPAP